MSRGRCQLVACAVLVVAAASTYAASTDVVAEIASLQARLIRDINNGQYDQVLSAYDSSYKGLVTEKGYLTLAARRQMFKEQFASDDPGTITIVETEVRPLCNEIAMLHSHLKDVYRKGKAPEEWWYTAIYRRSGDGWKVIYEQ